MLDEFIIRNALKTDMANVLKLYRELEEAYEGQGKTGAMMAPDVAWTQISSDARQHLLVAEAAGKIVGTLTLIVIPNIGHHGKPWGAIENVVVGKEHRGLGAGKNLMGAASNRARQLGCYKLILSSNLARTKAHEFYRRLGWKKTHIGFSLNNLD
ncbi:MAG: N-acetyltransferase family protein [Negativicutes bacterium]